eukprot:TRINITY_DN516_c0_g1_i4.p2 TRINITY_DN516_c0_g1~~TRINITY_DN516_c0_g1_i4.p2  ORF type:complete len:107 (-),score=29.94 TRINITY_DN516_c0_g1_i4:400-720(-)
MAAVGFVVDADGVLVPLNRPLMAPELYLEGGIDLAFDEAYRACDSSWEMIEPEELERGLETIRQMKRDNKADKWLESREALRLSCGQATFVVAKKPGSDQDTMTPQ